MTERRGADPAWDYELERSRLGFTEEEIREFRGLDRHPDGTKEHPCHTGYESERAFAVPGMGIVAEDDYYARLAHPDCEVCQQLYAEGFDRARNGFEPSPYWTGGLRQAKGRVERAGFDKYREVRGLPLWEER